MALGAANEDALMFLKGDMNLWIGELNLRKIGGESVDELIGRKIVLRMSRGLTFGA